MQLPFWLLHVRNSMIRFVYNPFLYSFSISVVFQLLTKQINIYVSHLQNWILRSRKLCLMFSHFNIFLETWTSLDVQQFGEDRVKYGVEWSVVIRTIKVSKYWGPIFRASPAQACLQSTLTLQRLSQTLRLGMGAELSLPVCRSAVATQNISQHRQIIYQTQTGFLSWSYLFSLLFLSFNIFVANDFAIVESWEVEESKFQEPLTVDDSVSFSPLQSQVVLLVDRSYPLAWAPIYNLISQR